MVHIATPKKACEIDLLVATVTGRLGPCTKLNENVALFEKSFNTQFLNSDGKLIITRCMCTIANGVQL